MMTHPVVFALVLVSATALTVVGVLMIMAALERRQDARAMAERLGSNRLDAVFLFEDGALVDANERGETLLRTLRAASPEKPPWQALRHYLTSGFPDLNQQLGRLAQQGRLALRAHDDSGLELQAEWLSGTIRMTLTDTEAEEGGVLIDRLSLRAMEEETDILRRVCEHAPVLAWREDASGRVTWANHAYLHLCARQSLAEGACQTFAWPLPALFPAAPAGTTQRMALSGTGRGKPEHWFDVIRHADADHQLAFALSADSAHRAEQSRLEFVQTLSKTFANLPIGLAVFDRARRLQLFNPAMADLTRLEPEFLTSRPSLAGFLNRLREKRVLPEPRNYENWSRRLLDIEKGVGTSEFEETWLLPSGQTYRVSVSPHLDGAMAFLVEDITTEIHMSRNIRAELETCQNAFDALPTAIALFSADGQLVQTNAAFSRLWSFEGETAIAGVTLAEALANWREASTDKALWDDIAALGTRGRPQARVAGTMVLSDGEVLSVSACGTGSAMLMITFDLVDPTATHGISVHKADAPLASADTGPAAPAEMVQSYPARPGHLPDQTGPVACSGLPQATEPGILASPAPGDTGNAGGRNLVRSGKPMRSGRIVRASA
ncbi:MAG: PAS-domain containing protein [Pararhodobacter sp.]|nr:PAS-domain containing protein [Pararhodobacter sp.]